MKNAWVVLVRIKPEIPSFVAGLDRDWRVDSVHQRKENAEKVKNVIEMCGDDYVKLQLSTYFE